MAFSNKLTKNQNYTCTKFVPIFIVCTCIKHQTYSWVLTVINVKIPTLSHKLSWTVLSKHQESDSELSYGCWLSCLN